MIKIIHTADIHLGKGFAFMGDKGKNIEANCLKIGKIID